VRGIKTHHGGTEIRRNSEKGLQRDDCRNAPEEPAQLQAALVEKLKAEGSVRSPQVEAAFRAVPRHLFLPGVPLDQVYSDEAIPTKHQDGLAISSSSQPAIMAIMLEQLGLEPGHRVLEIGAGTGYNAALMACLVGETGRVTTLDIDEDLAAGARECLAAAGFERVQVICADGGYGYEPGAPYDRIILTVGSEDIAPAWRDQLHPQGRLLLPLSLRVVQESVAFQPAGDHLESVSVRDCGFMMLRGAFAEPTTVISLGPEPGLHLCTAEPIPPDAGTLYEWLTGTSRDRPTAEVTLPHSHLGLQLWLALREPGYCFLNAWGEVAARAFVPSVFPLHPEQRWRFACGLLGKAGLALLSHPSSGASPVDRDSPAPVPSLVVLSYGPDTSLADRLVAQVLAWDAAGRPSTERLRIRTYPRESECTPDADAVVLEKRHTRLVLEWR
jgi:protein-L-isoaspartate(D-aspartate) O-methyltransferase